MIERDGCGHGTGIASVTGDDYCGGFGCANGDGYGDGYYAYGDGYYAYAQGSYSYGHVHYGYRNGDGDGSWTMFDVANNGDGIGDGICYPEDDDAIVAILEDEGKP